MDGVGGGELKRRRTLGQTHSKQNAFCCVLREIGIELSDGSGKSRSASVQDGLSQCVTINRQDISSIFDAARKLNSAIRKNTFSSSILNDAASEDTSTNANLDSFLDGMDYTLDCQWDMGFGSELLLNMKYVQPESNEENRGGISQSRHGKAPADFSNIDDKENDHVNHNDNLNIRQENDSLLAHRSFVHSCEIENNNNNYSSRGEVDFSLARLLLNTECTQERAALFFIGKIPEMNASDCEGADYLDTGNIQNAKISLPISRLLLQQFKWLIILQKNSTTITKSLLDILQALTDTLRQDVISLIPEIISDAEHAMVVEELEKIICESNDLMLPVLDALSNLTLERDLQDKVIQLVLNFLASAKISDLPIVVRFLIQNATEDNVKEVIDGLRQSLNFSHHGMTAMTIQDRKGKGKIEASEHHSEEKLCFESLKTGFSYKNLISERFLKELKAEILPERHRPVDFYLLLIIHTVSPTLKKEVEALLKKKISNGCLENTFFSQALREHGSLLASCFESLTQIASNLLLSRDARVRSGGSQIYHDTFISFKDSFHRQEVLIALTSHVSSGLEYEITTALRNLLTLAEEEGEVLIQYSAFLSSLLDFVDKFTDNQLRMLFEMFAELATNKFSAGTRLEDELRIFIQKQLISGSPRYKKVGVIASVTLIKHLGSSSKDGRESVQSLESCFLLLRPLLNNLKGSSQAASFLYDELSAAVSDANLHSSVLEFLNEQVFQDFEDTYFIDIDAAKEMCEQESNQLCEFKRELWLNLDDEETPVALSLIPSMFSRGVKTKHCLSVFTNKMQSMFSQFQLIVWIERKLCGNIELVNGLLGCPLLMFHRSLLEAETFNNLCNSDKQIICSSIFFAINWFRESLNAFAPMCNTVEQNSSQNSSSSQNHDGVTKKKILSRCAHICWLEEALKLCLSASERIYLPNYGDITGEPFLATKSLKPTLKKRKAAKHAGTRSVKIELGNRDNDTKSEDHMNDICTNRSAHSLEDGYSFTKALNEGNDNGIPHFRRFCRKLQYTCLELLIMQNSSVEVSRPTLLLPIQAFLLTELFHAILATTVADSKSSFKCFEVHYSQSYCMTLLDHDSTLHEIGPVVVGAISFKLIETATRVLLSQGESGERDEDNFNRLELANVHDLDIATQKDIDAFPKAIVSGVGNIQLGAIQVLKFCISCMKVLVHSKQLKERCDLRMKLFKFFNRNSHNENEPSSNCGDSQASSQQHPSLGRPELKALFSFWMNVLQQYRRLTVLSTIFDIEVVNILNSIAALDKEFVHEAQDLSDAAAKILEADYREVTLLDDQRDVDDSGSFTWKGHNAHITNLLKIYFSCGPNIIDRIRAMVEDELPAVSNRERNAGTNRFNSLTSHSFAVFFRCTFEALVREMGMISKILKNKCKEGNSNIGSELEKVKSCAASLHSLIKLSKLHEKKTSILASMIKYSTRFLDAALRSCEAFSVMAVVNGSVLEFIKEMQRSTRKLQNICNEGKVRMEPKIASLVPSAKKAMEKFIFLVKGLFNEAASAEISNQIKFVVGNLKHKDIKGHNVSSQFIPPDLDDDDDDVDDDDDTECNDGIEGEETENDDGDNETEHGSETNCDDNDDEDDNENDDNNSDDNNSDDVDDNDDVDDDGNDNENDLDDYLYALGNHNDTTENEHADSDTILKKNSREGQEGAYESSPCPSTILRYESDNPSCSELKSDIEL